MDWQGDNICTAHVFILCASSGALLEVKEETLESNALKQLRYEASIHQRTAASAQEAYETTMRKIQRMEQTAVASTDELQEEQTTRAAVDDADEDPEEGLPSDLAELESGLDQGWNVPEADRADKRMVEVLTCLEPQCGIITPGVLLCDECFRGAAAAAAAGRLSCTVWMRMGTGTWIKER